MAKRYIETTPAGKVVTEIVSFLSTVDRVREVRYQAKETASGWSASGRTEREAYNRLKSADHTG